MRSYDHLKNTAALEAFRARQKAAVKAGQPFFILALLAFEAPSFMLAAHLRTLWFVWIAGASAAIGLIAIVFSAYLRVRHLKRHPDDTSY